MMVKSQSDALWETRPTVVIARDLSANDAQFATAVEVSLRLANGILNGALLPDKALEPPTNIY